MMEDTSTVLHQANASLAEGPIWDGRLGAIYWVDIRRCRIHRFRVAEGRQDAVWVLRDSVGCIGLTADPDVLVVAAGLDVFLLNLTTGRETPVASLPLDSSLMRANDGRVDSAGNFWVGTMIDDIHAPSAFAGGRLFCVTPTGTVHDSGIEFELPNGMGWAPDGATFYINDSTALRTYAFDFDAQSRALSRQRIHFAHPADEGLPDGLTIGSDGHVWSGQWNGWNIKRIDAAGQLQHTYAVPVQRPSSVAFFGDRLDRMTYTSAANGFGMQDLLQAPEAGSLFELEVTGTGLAENYFGI